MIIMITIITIIIMMNDQEWCLGGRRAGPLLSNIHDGEVSFLFRLAESGRDSLQSLRRGRRRL